jgi:hypothetical protein
MYVGIYLETSSTFTLERNLIIVKQTEIADSGSLIKKLKSLLIKGFKDTLAVTYGSKCIVGIYTSDTSFNTLVNHAPVTFFMVVNNCRNILTVESYIDCPKIDSIHKMRFDYKGLRLICPNDLTINQICDIEEQFWKSTTNRADTIKLLREFDANATIKWYNLTSTLRDRCRKHIRRKIINILADNAKSTNV